MKNNILGKLLCGAMVLFAAMSFTACVDDNEDVGMPYLELDSEVLPFTLEGGDATFMVNTNRPWFITKSENSDWLTVEPMAGDGAAQVKIQMTAATTGREATLNFNIANTYGVYLTKSMKIQQGEIAAAEVLWHENFGDTGQTSSPWPLVSEYADSKWEKGGLYGANVTYTAVSGTMSLRNSGKLSAGYADASGAAKLFFGSGSPVFVAGNIQTDGAVNYTLNFGGGYSKSNNGVYDNTFYTDKFHVYISGDNQKWSEVTYTTAQADEFWVYATAQFTLKEAADVLYVKFAATEASVYAIDDVQLVSGGVGRQEIDLAAGSEGEGGNEGGDEGGNEPAPDTSNAIWYESFGVPVKDGNYWPYAAENATNIMSGTGVVQGTTAYKSETVTTRLVSSQSSPNPPCSGEGHVWFPANKAIAENYFMVEKLALNNQKNLDITFYLYGNGTAYTTGDLVLELSADGATWTKVNFTTTAVSGADWVKAATSVTLKEAAAHLYIRFSSATTAGFRFDDPMLTIGNGGTEIDLAAGGTTPEPEPDTPTDGTATTITEMIGMMDASQTVTLDKDYVLEGVVLSDVEGGNYTGNNLVLQTEGSTTAKNGVVLFGSQVDPKTLALSRGDKVKVTLLQGKAQLKIYNDLYEITGAQSDTWCKVEKIGTGTIAPTVITVSQMKDFQSMLVTIKNVTATEDATWDVGTTTMLVGSEKLTVYVKSGATAFAGKSYKVSTADITGIVTMYKGAVQLAPRDMADVAGFATTTSPDEGGDEPDPDPTPDPNPNPGETVYFWQDDFSQFNDKTADGTVDLGNSLKGSVAGFTDAYQSVAKVYEAAGKVKCGSSSAMGTLTTPAMKNVSGSAEATLTVDLATWVNEKGAADATTIVITINNAGTINGAASVTTEQLTAEMKTFTYNLSGVTSATTITIAATAKSKKRYYLDNLIIKQK